MKNLHWKVWIGLIGSLGLIGSVEGQDLKYPETKTVDQLDEYFGTVVADPYRWLEDDVRESGDVENWVEAQNQLTFGYLESLPYREQIKQRLTELWDYEKYGVPAQEGKAYYFRKNDGLQNQSVLYRQVSSDAEPQVLLDPNQWSSDGTVALGATVFSKDGQLMAYSTSEGGSDWSTWHVLETETGRKLPDEIQWTKFSSVSWTPDNSGFYYCAYDRPEEGATFQSLNLNQKVYYHQLGTDQKQDRLVHATPEHPDWGFYAEVSDDGQYLIITTWKGTDDKYRIEYRKLDDAESELQVLADNFDHQYSYIDNQGSKLFFISDRDAPNRCVLSVELKGEKPEWEVVVPEAEETLISASRVGEYLTTDYLKDAVTQVKIYTLEGSLVREVEFPGLGTASGFSGDRKSTETFYSFASFNRPPSIYRYDVATGENQLWREAEVDFDPEQYVVKQVFYNSKDGTRIPMFLSHRKDLVPDGKTPTLLYGYGGFNIPLPPSFSVPRLQWMEMGGIYAVANLRGGGEYGEAWHQAGTKTNKQNVFDDFIAAAEYLIQEKYTDSQHLAIEGRSNGGLLVGACMTQRPELYAACLPAVGVMDMLRFQEFTAGRFWVDDYGSSRNSKEQFDALHAYSPYHNIQNGVSYPPTMVTTADHDDRVVPGHSFKFIARLQAAQAGKQPVLIRIETKAGHGAGKPTSKQIEEVSDLYAFLVKHLKMKPQL